VRFSNAVLLVSCFSLQAILQLGATLDYFVYRLAGIGFFDFLSASRSREESKRNHENPVRDRILAAALHFLIFSSFFIRCNGQRDSEKECLEPPVSPLAWMLGN
jgi:hypothetical protein